LNNIPLEENMKGELSVVSKQNQYSSNKVPILVEGDIATNMEEVK